MFSITKVFFLRGIVNNMLSSSTCRFLHGIWSSYCTVSQMNIGVNLLRLLKVIHFVLCVAVILAVPFPIATMIG